MAILNNWRLFFPSPVPLGVFIAAAAGCLALVLWSYWRPIAAPPPRLRALLAALRIIAVALILFFILDPFERRRVRQDKKPVVAFLIDNSRSMRLSDSDKGKPRIEPPLETLLTGKNAIAGGLSENLQTKAFVFSQELSLLPAGESVKTDGTRTDIAGALSALVEALRDEKLAAVILLSDGADNVGLPLAPVLRGYRQEGVPIYALPAGKAGVLKDVEIAEVSVARRVSLGTEVSLEVFIQTRGYGDRDTVVELLKDGEPVRSKKVKLKDGKQRVAMSFVPEDEGFIRYSVRVPPLDDEIIKTNNSDTVVIDSKRSRIRVLYMEGSQYRQPERKLWEFQYLVQALEADRDIEVTPLFKDDVVAAQQAGIGYVRDPVRGFPTEKKKLYEFDVIISSDIDIEYFTPEQLKYVVDFVAKHGGGFAMIGGYTAFGAGGYDESVIDKLLPVDMQGRRDGYFEDYQDMFRPKLTADGLKHPICKLSADPDENREIWERIPTFGGFNYTEKAKDGATALALHPTRRNENGAYVIIAVQQYGRGRSLALTTDTTAGWGNFFEADWGEEGDNRHFRKFWQNAIRWLARYRIAIPNKPVLARTTYNRYAPGDIVEILVECLDPDYEPTHQADVSGSVKIPGEAMRKLKFRPDLNMPGRYRADLRTGATGQYEVKVDASFVGDPLGEDTLLFFCDETNVEFRNPEPAPEVLDMIAKTTGGRVMTADKLPEMASQINQDLADEERFTTRRFWTRWLFLALALLALTAEWFIRRRAGIP